MTGEPVTIADIDRWTRHIWHVSQHGKIVIGLAGRLQWIVQEMRAAAGLPEFGWNTAFPDAEFGECSVHVEGCRGQETHEANRVLPWTVRELAAALAELPEELQDLQVFFTADWTVVSGIGGACEHYGKWVVEIS